MGGPPSGGSAGDSGTADAPVSPGPVTPVPAEAGPAEAVGSWMAVQGAPDDLTAGPRYDRRRLRPEPELVPGEPGPAVDRLVRQALGRHMLLGEMALVCTWAFVSFVVFHFLTSGHASTAAAVSLAWLFAGASGVMVVVILAFRRVAERRIRQGLHDASTALRSIESVTDPALSFLPLDALLEELLARTCRVVGGESATIFLVTDDGRSLTVRASRGPAEPAAGAAIGVGEGVVGAVAQRAEAVIVNEVSDSILASSWGNRDVVSLVAAPLLVGGHVIGVVQVGTAQKHRFVTRDLRLLQLVADRSAASIERARLDQDARRSRLGAEHARLHLSILALAGDEMATALESYDDALTRLVGVIVPTFADWFAVDLAESSGEVRRVACGARARDPVASSLHRHPEGDALVHRVMASGRPEVLMNTQDRGPDSATSESTEAGGYSEAPPAAGIESMVIVPVHVRGLSFGALSFVTGAGRRGYRPSDLDTARGLAERVAIAVERVLLWRESRAAERAATRNAGQLRRLMEAALAVNAPLAESEVLRVVADHARRILGADAAVVAPVTDTPDGTGLVEVASPATLGPAETALVGVACDLVATSDRPVRWPGGEGPDDPDRRADAHGTGAARAGSGVPWLAVPLADASGSTGRVIVVIGGPGGPFNTEDESVMVLLAQMASVALMNARLYQAVQSNEHRLRAVVESSPLAIAEVDMTGDARWWNGAAGILFGWRDGADVARRVSGDEAAATVLEELWSRTAHGVASVGTDLVTTGPNGKSLELSVSTAPLFDHEGTVTGILVVAEDVTERRRMLEQFHQAERLGAMARLAGGVAHDFNNLLTVILGSSEVLLRRAAVDDEWRDDVAAIQRAGERAAALTSQLLAIGHRRPVQSVVVDPDSVMESMRPMLVRLLGEDVELVLVAGSPPGLILADPAELERALLNMVINARDAMPDGGLLEFRTRVVGADLPGSWRMVALMVSDTGAGMDAETIEHCFEPFFTTKGLARGTGLGLAAVHAMVTQAGGHITVESTVGSGTTFTLWFPAAEAELAVEKPEAEVLLDRGDEVILLVEDEEELRRLAVRELDRRGYAVVVASGGAEALEVARSLDGRIDLLVTDVVMPGMSGVELAARANELWPLLPVLFVSGHLDEGSVGRQRMAEDADLLAKPFTPDQLGHRVRQALDRSQARGREGVGTGDWRSRPNRAAWS
ncbi:MAG TPA: GAF domain-containing protein [Acidimicrobiales bacterium]|nr:GAF domain-containing protein [Acidimicrobiales bacterium]